MIKGRNKVRMVLWTFTVPIPAACILLCGQPALNFHMLIQFMTLPALISLYDHVKAQGSSSVHKSTVYFCMCVCVRFVCACVCIWLCLRVRVTLLASWLSLWRMLTGRTEPHWGRERQETWHAAALNTQERYMQANISIKLDKKHAKIMKCSPLTREAKDELYHDNIL